jgi:protein-tyrosine phosphatase
MKKLKLLSAALLLAQMPLALAFPASVERTGDGQLQLTWDAGANTAVDVYVEYRHADKAERQLISKADADGKHQLAANAERAYFVLSTNKGEEQIVAERLLPLAGGNNFRDLGGYETADGKHVRWGTLYRSGVMTNLTAADYSYLNELGIRTVCDFRSTEERTTEPTLWQGNSKPTRHETDYVMDNSALAKSLMTPGSTPEQVKQVFADFYKEVPFNFSAQYKEMFAELVAGHTPLAFNCSAGKDRTGVASALLLTALGVPRDAAIADYLLSNQYYKPAQPKPGAQDANSRLMASLPPELLKILMGVDTQYIQAAFAEIEKRHGSVEAYLEQVLAVDAADLAMLRKRYIE